MKELLFNISFTNQTRVFWRTFALYLLIILVMSCKRSEAQQSDTGSYAPLFWQEHWYEHDQNLTRVYLSKYVAGYIDDDVVNPSSIRWVFEHYSKVWRYVKNVYGYFGRDSYLYVVHHAGKYDGGHPAFYFEADHGFRNVLDTGFVSTRDPWEKKENDEDNVPLIIDETWGIGFFAELASKQTRGSPASRVWGANKGGGTKWMEIFTYDVLLNIGLTMEAEKYLKSVMDTRENFPTEGTYWMRDWFWPIYTKYNGISIFRQFFSQVQLNWPSQRYVSKGNETLSPSEFVVSEYKGGMNMGEFVHFWSGAAGVSLRDMAVIAFNWTHEYQAMFEKARINYPSIEYPCDDCKEFPNLRSELIKHQQQQEETVKQELTTVIAASVSSLLLLVSVLVIALIMYRKKVIYLRNHIRELTNEEVKDFFKGNSNFSDGEVNNSSVHSMPFNSAYEIPQDKLVVAHDQVIGSGAFGLVLHGIIKGLKRDNPEGFTPVAVKTVRQDVEVEIFKALLLELKILAHLGGHENLVSLLGASTVNIKQRELFVALEMCEHGDLRAFLVKHRNKFQSLIPPDNAPVEGFSSLDTTGTSSDTTYLVIPSDEKLEVELLPNKSAMYANSNMPKAESIIDLSSTDYSNATTTLTTLNLALWSQDIARGMQYISDKKVIHGDLAARNVLLTTSNVAKVSDFGLSRQLLNYSTYLKTSTGPLPWRWLAVESLKDMKFSTQSDVWAFGVTMWETFTLGELPYPGWTWDYNFVDNLVEGDRLKSPPYANSEIYQIMADCWELNSTHRPSFKEIQDKLKGVISDLQSSASQERQD